MSFKKGNTFWKQHVGKKLSNEHKKKISANHARAMQGKSLSEEAKEKISNANKRKHLSLPTEFKKGHLVSKETREKISIAIKGKKYPPRSLEHRMKISKNMRGEKSRWWKGGVYPIHKAIRCSFEYKLWRTAVFERDNYTCIWCGVRGGKLNADHIKPFALYPELRFAIDNGRTLCEDCHKTTDTYGGKTKQTL